jgi:hypothetical protein
MAEFDAWVTFAVDNVINRVELKRSVWPRAKPLASGD